MSIFQTKEYLDLFARHFVLDDASIVNKAFEILTDKKAVLLGMKPVLNNQEITDFGDIGPRSEDDLRQSIQILKDDHYVSSVQFDYIKESSQFFKVLSTISKTSPILQEVSPYILLPDSWEIYLESLERTDRKELKRKFKRLDTISHIFRCIDSSLAALRSGGAEGDTSLIGEFDEFVKLHRLSDVSKNQFMTESMKSFFWDLLSLKIPGWQQKLAFLDIEGKPAASVFYFESEKEILLYNSGYDPEQKFYSVGLLLIASLIKKSIEGHKSKFDFLRGNERYKYDLGAKDERLFQFIFSS